MRVKLSKRHQVTIPRSVLEQLRVAPGQDLILEVRDGAIELRPEPKDWSTAFRGLGREIWEGVDPVEYIRRERGVCPD